MQRYINTSSNSLPLKVSGCILPGMDFRANPGKECQDNYVFFMHNGCLFCILCDGHGSEGNIISKFIVEYTEKYFKKHFSKFRLDPKGLISEMLQKCDKKIILHVPCELSGSTVIVLFIDNNIINCGSLGDSRSILGSLSAIPERAIPLRAGKYFRRITCDRFFKTSLLTLDQKPENPDELVRIRQSGGIVEKYADPFGRNIGPYRV